MGKKKRGHPDVEDVLARPWCYYCERDFEDLKLLISHQKAKHFKCDRCGRRLNTAGGLAVHLNQVHKETLEHVENALPNRQGTDIEIFGMEGIPAEILEQHRNRIIQNFYQAQEDRRLATGNPPPGQSQPRKKIKIETAEELLARFKEFQKAKKEGAADPNNPNGNAMDGVVATGPSPGGFANQPYPPPAQPGFDQSYGQPGLPQPPPQGYGGYPGDAGIPSRPGQSGDDIDQLIRMAEAGVKPQAGTEAAAGEDKKAKKEKKGRMVYDDAEISPEERMSKFPRYAYTPPEVALTA